MIQCAVDSLQLTLEIDGGIMHSLKMQGEIEGSKRARALSFANELGRQSHEVSLTVTMKTWLVLVQLEAYTKRGSDLSLPLPLSLLSFAPTTI